MNVRVFPVVGLFSLALLLGLLSACPGTVVGMASGGGGDTTSSTTGGGGDGTTSSTASGGSSGGGSGGGGGGSGGATVGWFSTCSEDGISYNAQGQLSYPPNECSNQPHAFGAYLPATPNSVPPMNMPLPLFGQYALAALTPAGMNGGGITQLRVNFAPAGTTIPGSPSCGALATVVLWTVTNGPPGNVGGSPGPYEPCMSSNPNVWTSIDVPASQTLGTWTAPVSISLGSDQTLLLAVQLNGSDQLMNCVEAFHDQGEEADYVSNMATVSLNDQLIYDDGAGNCSYESVASSVLGQQAERPIPPIDPFIHWDFSAFFQ